MKNRRKSTGHLSSNNSNNNQEGNTPSWQFVCNYCGESKYRSSKYAACMIADYHLHPSEYKQVIMFQPQATGNQSRILYNKEIQAYLKRKRDEFLEL